MRIGVNSFFDKVVRNLDISLSVAEKDEVNSNKRSEFNIISALVTNLKKEGQRLQSIKKLVGEIIEQLNPLLENTNKSLCSSAVNEGQIAQQQALLISKLK